MNGWTRLFYGIHFWREAVPKSYHSATPGLLYTARLSWIHWLVAWQWHTYVVKPIGLKSIFNLSTSTDLFSITYYMLNMSSIYFSELWWWNISLNYGVGIFLSHQCRHLLFPEVSLQEGWPPVAGSQRQGTWCRGFWSARRTGGPFVSCIFPYLLKRQTWGTSSPLKPRNSANSMAMASVTPVWMSTGTFNFSMILLSVFMILPYQTSLNV